MFTIPTLLSAIGGGLDILGDFSAADQYRQTADLNYQIATTNAKGELDASLTALKIGGLRNRIGMDAARTNLRLTLADAEARERNAQRLQSFAEMRTTQGREAIRRARRNFDALKGKQMAAIASSGVTASGSPLEVMADSAREAATALADMWDETSLERAEIQDRAAMERFGAAQTRIGARAEFGLARRSSRIDRTTAKLARLTAHSQYRSALFSAQAEKAMGYSAASVSTASGIGGIFAGSANLFSTLRSNKDLGA